MGRVRLEYPQALRLWDGAGETGSPRPDGNVDADRSAGIAPLSVAAGCGIATKG